MDFKKTLALGATILGCHYNPVPTDLMDSPSLKAAVKKPDKIENFSQCEDLKLHYTLQHAKAAALDSARQGAYQIFCLGRDGVTMRSDDPRLPLTQVKQVDTTLTKSQICLNLQISTRDLSCDTLRQVSHIRN